MQLGQFRHEVIGCRLLADERVQRALVERSRQALVDLAPSAIRALASVLESERATGAERVAAAKVIFDRAGLHGVTEQRQSVELAADPEQVRRIGVMIAMLGLPAEVEAKMREKLLGGRLAQLAPMVDVTPERGRA